MRSMPIPRAVAVVVDGPRVLVIKRFLRRPSADSCAMCKNGGISGPGCPGHRYAVLPGGHVEDGESARTAALRELWEETTLEARIDRLLWTGLHNDRPAFYYLMTEISGTPVLSGPEAQEQSSDNSFELTWAAADDFDGLNLHPADVRARLRGLVDR